MGDSARKMVILKTGSTFPSIRNKFGDFDHWIVATTGLRPEETLVVDAAGIDELPAGDRSCGVIITGSHDMVTDNKDWIKRASMWVSAIVRRRIPVLGICFGHQLLAQAMGGEVGYHPKGREIGTVPVYLTPAGTKDTLTGGLPKLFPAHASHAQTVIRLPQGAHCLAFNRFEAHHAFRIGHCAWGVQFHPEFSAQVMHAYIEAHTETLREAGFSLSALRNGISDTAAASSLLKKFTVYCHCG
jgi:GMP synthase (glutamine-hydrolysing)